MHHFFKGLIIGLCCIAPLAVADKDANYSPYAAVNNYPQNVYWGDTHLHTVLSADAYGYQTTLTPDDAYAFAKGKQVISHAGQSVKLSRPLDFLVVSDHAEYLAAYSMFLNKDPLIDGTEFSAWLNKTLGSSLKEVLMVFHKNTMGLKRQPYDDVLKKSGWHQVVDAAERHNQPSIFTAFIGYEWTSLPSGNNLHRNVIFRDGADKTLQILPFSAMDSQNPEDLWDFLQNYENQTGGEVLAIPHNPNVSNGAMFVDKTYHGEPFTKAYANTRMRWEPLMEATQIKGDSEAHPLLSPEDEFADYESWDFGNFSLPTDTKEPWMLQYEYARSALKNGLKLEQTLGVNPFKFGMIGSTDSHIAMSAVEENSFFGKWAPEEPSEARMFDTKGMPVKTYASSGFAGVWAKENTREALFDAMQRKETYATTGPRMVVRFFGGWNFAKHDDLRPDYDLIGYRKGVPMGGDLYKSTNKQQAPQFLVVASKDPVGANLDRVQIVKGWLNADGTTAEKVYNIAVSDQRKIHKNKVKALKSSVDIDTATYTNTIGAVQLSKVWQDPDFDPQQRAFYYVRVLEISTPRWTTYDAAFYGTELPEGVPAEHQERAYTSPIWYTP